MASAGATPKAAASNASTPASHLLAGEVRESETMKRLVLGVKRVAGEWGRQEAIRQEAIRGQRRVAQSYRGRQGASGWGWRGTEAKEMHSTIRWREARS